jgi:hypothetical protein
MSASAIFTGLVTHERFAAPPHRFRYPVCLYLLDLDELPELDRRLRLFGWNRPRPASFRDGDHLGDPGRSLAGNLRAFVESQGQRWPGGRVLALTNCRVFGYVFNPLSLFYCFDGEGALRAVVAEVNNTFGDRHPYLLVVPDREPPESCRPGDRPRFTWREKKVMHVSPFLSLDGTYVFDLEAPSDRVRVRIDLTAGGATQLSATLALDRRMELSDAAIARSLLRYPFETMKVIGAIHWEALRLWRKRAPFWSRPPYDPDAARRRPA